MKSILTCIKSGDMAQTGEIFTLLQILILLCTKRNLMVSKSIVIFVSNAPTVRAID